jgi:hypothetical protein
MDEDRYQCEWCGDDIGILHDAGASLNDASLRGELVCSWCLDAAERAIAEIPLSMCTCGRHAQPATSHVAGCPDEVDRREPQT